MEARPWSATFSAVAFTLFLVGCGGDSSNNRPRENANVAGNWHATVTSSSAPVTTDLDFFIVQSGTSLASSLVLFNGTPCASQGTLTGTVDQQAVDLTIRESDGPDTITVPDSTDGVSAAATPSAALATAGTLEPFSPILFQPSIAPAGPAIQAPSMVRLLSPQICKRILMAISTEP
jgi:hypothetical protein